MAYYFGFLPSVALDSALDEANRLVKTMPTTHEPLYISRNHITHLVKSELVDVMLVQIVEALPDESERKIQLQKICKTVETTTDKLISAILGTASNEEVMLSFQFLEEKTLFEDTAGKRRVGLVISDKLGSELTHCFRAIQASKKEETVETAKNVAQLTTLLSELTDAAMQHFLIDFTQTLNLGRLKRTAIPVAQSVINKVSHVALHKLLPQMPQAGLERIVNHYQPLIFQK